MKKATIPLSHLVIAHSYNSASSESKKHLSAVKREESKNFFFDRKDIIELKTENNTDPGEKDPGWYSSYE